MHRDPLSIASGESLNFAIAGHGIRVHVDPGFPGRLSLPGSFRPFLAAPKAHELEIHVSSAERLERARGALLRDSGLHWRAVDANDATVFEFIHPPSGTLYCQARADGSFSRFEVLLSESQRNRDFTLPHPLEQLLLVPAFATRGTVLFHACGAVVGSEGLVFAGHSGEGKTTLGRLLESEGATLLSDERIAVRRVDNGFVAFGTPWPGEGDAVSNGAPPLGGMFVLKKASRHALSAKSLRLAPDLIARAIVPYYLPGVAERILDTFSELASTVPLRELSFARLPGLANLLQEIGSPCVSA